MKDSHVYHFAWNLKIVLDGNEIPDDTPITFVGPDGTEGPTMPYGDAKEWHDYTTSNQAKGELRVGTIPY